MSQACLWSIDTNRRLINNSSKRR